MDTIFAVATARGKAGVAVVRISGPGADACHQVFGFGLPPTRQASVRRLLDADGELLDEALVLRFPEGASFTGERVMELQLHGSPAIVASVLSRLSGIDGHRIAEPGEFTRRALENERLDLAQVEGLSDLIDAETETQRKQAQRVFSGALGEKVEGWRGRLIEALALLEVTIDFADEDVPVDVTPEVLRTLEALKVELNAEVEGIVISERIRDGFEVAIVGPPNIGKSTLLNALAGRDAAITSEVAGTTRDVIEVRMDLDGLPVTILDTAGVRDSDDVVETIGIQRAIERAKGADLRVILTESAQPVMEPLDGDIVVQGKADLRSAEGKLSVSGKTGEGVGVLVRSIADRLASLSLKSSIATRERHRAAMISGLGLLESALSGLREGDVSVELVAEDIRGVVGALGVLTGRVDVEHVLGEIFGRFCLGK